MNYKVLLGFVTGAVLGAGGTYIYMKKRCNEEINAETEAVREYYENKTCNCDCHAESDEKPVESTKKLSKEDIDISNAESVETLFGQNRALQRHSEKPVTDYTAYSNQKSGEEVEKPDISVNNPFKKGPYIISEEEFSDEHPEYDKISALYEINVAGEAVIKSHNGETYEEYEDWEDIVGFDCLDSFRGPEAVETLYVRNDDFGVDFQIDFYGEE